MKEVVSLQYRASASDSWQSQRLSHKGNRLTLSDKDSDMGTVYESEAELHIRTANYGIPAMDLLVRMWHIDDTYTDIGTATNPVRVQKRVDGAMVTAVLKHESITAPVHGSVLYIPIQVGSEQVFPGASFISIHPDSPASSFAIDGVHGVYTKMLTANTTVMLEVYYAEAFRFQGMTFGGCKYVNLSQIKAKGVVVAGLYNGKTAVRLLTPLTKIDLPREIDAQVLSIESLNEMQAISFASVADMSGKIINLPTLLTGDIERTLQSLIDAGYTDVRLGISLLRSPSSALLDILATLIDDYRYVIPARWMTYNRAINYLNPEVNELGYIINIRMELYIYTSPYLSGSYNLISHPAITVRYDGDNDVLYGKLPNNDEIVLLSDIYLHNTYIILEWKKIGTVCYLVINGVDKLSVDYSDIQVSGNLLFSFGSCTVVKLTITGNPSIERDYTAYPRGYLREKRNTETRDKYLTNIDNVPVLVLLQYSTPW